MDKLARRRDHRRRRQVADNGGLESSLHAFDRGYLSPYFSTSNANAVLDTRRLLTTKRSAHPLTWCRPSSKRGSASLLIIAEKSRRSCSHLWCSTASRHPEDLVVKLRGFVIVVRHAGSSPFCCGTVSPRSRLTLGKALERSCHAIASSGKRNTTLSTAQAVQAHLLRSKRSVHNRRSDHDYDTENCRRVPAGRGFALIKSARALVEMKKEKHALKLFARNPRSVRACSARRCAYPRQA